MTIHPWRRQERLDHAELARLLPAPGDPVLSRDLQRTLEDHLMNAMRSESPRPARRRTIGARIALPAGLAAAVAGVALTMLPAQTAAAYTLEGGRGGLVKLTIVKPAGKIDTGGLRRDLAAAGVRAKVLLGDPRCASPVGSGPAPAPSLSLGTDPVPPVPSGSHSAQEVPGDLQRTDGSSPAPAPALFRVVREDDRTVAYVDPARIPAGTTLTFGFPLAKTDPGHGLDVLTIGMDTGGGPDCIPAAPRGAVQPR